MTFDMLTHLPALQAPGFHALTVEGPPCIGKTSLMLNVARQIVVEGRYGLWLTNHDDTLIVKDAFFKPFSPRHADRLDMRIHGFHVYQFDRRFLEWHCPRGAVICCDINLANRHRSIGDALGLYLDLLDQARSLQAVFMVSITLPLPWEAHAPLEVGAHTRIVLEGKPRRNPKPNQRIITLYHHGVPQPTSLVAKFDPAEQTFLA